MCYQEMEFIEDNKKQAISTMIRQETLSRKDVGEIVDIDAAMNVYESKKYEGLMIAEARELLKRMNENQGKAAEDKMKIIDSKKEKINIELDYYLNLAESGKYLNLVFGFSLGLAYFLSYYGLKYACKKGEKQEKKDETSEKEYLIQEKVINNEELNLLKKKKAIEDKLEKQRLLKRDIKEELDTIDETRNRSRGSGDKTVKSNTNNDSK